MKLLQGGIFGTRVPFKRTFEVNVRRIFGDKKKWFLSRTGDSLRAFGYGRSYSDSNNLFSSTQLSGKLDLLQLASLLTGVILLSRSTGGELLNVAAIVSLFEAVSFTGDTLRNMTSTLDRSERLLYRGLVGKEYATEVMHDSELAMTFSVLWNFILAIIVLLLRYPVMREGMVRAYHVSLVLLYCLAYVEKVFNYKLAAVISIFIETQVFSGRISDQVAVAMLSSAFAIRVVKLICSLAGSRLYAQISSSACIFGVDTARKVLDGIPASEEEVCSRIYISQNSMYKVAAEHLESAIVTRLSFNNDTADLSHELVSEFDDPEESCTSVIVSIKDTNQVSGTYNTKAIAGSAIAREVFVRGEAEVQI